MAANDDHILIAGMLALVIHAAIMLIVVIPAPLQQPSLANQRTIGITLVCRRPAHIKAAAVSRKKNIPSAIPKKVEQKKPPEPRLIKKKIAVEKTVRSFIPARQEMKPQVKESGPETAENNTPKPQKINDSPISSSWPDVEEKNQGQGMVVRQAAPLYQENSSPVYPRKARRRGWQGVVMLNVLVSAEGKPLEIKVAKSSGHGILDLAARKSVAEWRFSPGRRGKEAIAMRVMIPVRFELR